LSRRRERGVALVAAAASLAVLSVVALGLARTAIVDQRLTYNALTAAQAEALARSGIAAASVLLAEHAGGSLPDTLRAPWAVDLGPQPYGAGSVVVHVEDEARRLDLGTCADVLPRLLHELDLDPGLADAIADWTDRDDTPRLHGAERGWYLTLRPPYLPRNAPLASTDELARVRGVDANALARLRPFVTAAGEMAVNPNTAPREVLVALADAATADALLAARVRAPIVPATDLARLLPALSEDRRRALQRRMTARGQHYTVRALGTVGEARRTVEAVVAGAGGRVVAWRAATPFPLPVTAP
jgi:general secretion pathway protein K